MKRPFRERLFIVLWCLWGFWSAGTSLIIIWGFLQGVFLNFNDYAGLTLPHLVIAVPLILLQYLATGLVNPIKLLAPKALNT